MIMVLGEICTKPFNLAGFQGALADLHALNSSGLGSVEKRQMHAAEGQLMNCELGP